MPPISILVALADPTRCRIIEILHQGPQPVHVLAGSFKISRPAISRHLRVLKQAKLISEKKIGRENRYALHAARLKPVNEWVSNLLPTGKPAPEAAPAVEVAPAPAPQPTPAPAPVAKPPKPKTTKPTAAPTHKLFEPPAAEPPISQMGFDF